jgi:hypothetical protein
MEIAVTTPRKHQEWGRSKKKKTRRKRRGEKKQGKNKR